MNIVGRRMKGRGDGHCAGVEAGRWPCPVLDGAAKTRSAKAAAFHTTEQSDPKTGVSAAHGGDRQRPIGRHRDIFCPAINPAQNRQRGLFRRRLLR